MSQTEIFFLGTCSGIPSKSRGHTSLAIRHNGEVMLFDCGENCQRQLISLSISIMKIDRIFITHWHADHYAGLLALPQSMFLLKRTRPLAVYGPSGTRKNIGLLKKLIGKLGYDFSAKEVRKEIVFEGQDYTIRCMRTAHSTHSLAYSFEENPRRKFLEENAKNLGVFGLQRRALSEGRPITVNGRKIMPEEVLSGPIPGKKIVYSGDTKALESMADFARDADILVHEATFAQDREAEAIEYLHSTARQAARIAKEANVKRLFLVHSSPRYEDVRVLESEAREVFPNTFFPNDLDKVVL